MDRDRWKAVNNIFHAALEVSPEERQGFVATAAEGDADLQAEVELLLAADADARSLIHSQFLPSSLLHNLAPPVSPGDVLCGRFRIVRPVAEGGMGHVYEAFDTELAVRVALKVIRPEISSDPEALARFRQEVRLARRITHPNVCRTFDLERDTRGASENLVFLTMEFLEGETLATHIERIGALPLDEALKIARQIADALETARTLGIVHRDMKPANVMLVPDPAGEDNGVRAVITDFGLARLDPLLNPLIDPLLASGSASALTRSAMTRSARPIGTLAYMAPEQLQGAQVSAATDIYAYGLILFEMVTGKRAFPSKNFLSGIAQRLTGPAPDPQAHAPSLPEPWRRAIAGCLRTAPAERFASAADVIATLDGGRARLPRQPRYRIAITRPRTLLWIAALLLAAVALFTGALRFYQSRADSRVAPGAMVYVTQVKNQTGEKALNNVTELLQAGLSQSAQVNLLDQDRVGDILQQMNRPPETTIDEPTAREIAMRAGAVRVVFATVSGSKGNYKLAVDIQQPDNTPARYRNHWTRDFSWHSTPAASSGAIAPELLTTLRTASDWIRHEAGESANDIARLDVPPEDVTTSSWQALALYDQAQDWIASRQLEKGIDLLRDAVQCDPHFALAYARLADVLNSLSRDQEADQAYRKALDTDLETRLTRRERDRIRGMYALDTEDEQTAEAAFRDYAEFYEHDYAGWFYRAYPLLMLGRTPEAIETLLRAFAVDPNRLSAPAHLARFYPVVNDLPDAWKWQKWMATHGFHDDANFAAGQIEMVEQRYDQAEQSFRLVAQSSDPYYRSFGDSLLSRIYAERGDLSQARAALDSGMEVDSSNGYDALRAGKLIDRAYLRCKVNDIADAVQDIGAAIRTYSGAQALLLSSQVLGECDDLSGRNAKESIETELRSVAQKIPDPGENLLLRDANYRAHGELLLAEGSWKKALREFQAADALEPPAANRDYLARAYRIASSLDDDKAEAARYRANAFDLSLRVADQPALNWYLMVELPPGDYADDLEKCLSLADQVHPPAETINRLRARYSALRGKTAPLILLRPA